MKTQEIKPLREIKKDLNDLIKHFRSFGYFSTISCLSEIVKKVDVLLKKTKSSGGDK